MGLTRIKQCVAYDIQYPVLHVLQFQMKLKNTQFQFLELKMYCHSKWNWKYAAAISPIETYPHKNVFRIRWSVRAIIIVTHVVQLYPERSWSAVVCELKNKTKQNKNKHPHTPTPTHTKQTNKQTKNKTNKT